MSKERKTLKILSLLFWVVSIVMIASAIHGFMKGVVGISLSMLVIGIAGLFYGWMGIQGANTPSKINTLPVMSLALGVIDVIWLSLIAINFIPAETHVRVVSLVIFGIVALILFALNTYAKRVAEQVSL